MIRAFLAIILFIISAAIVADDSNCQVNGEYNLTATAVDFSVDEVDTEDNAALVGSVLASVQIKQSYLLQELSFDGSYASGSNTQQPRAPPIKNVI